MTKKKTVTKKSQTGTSKKNEGKKSSQTETKKKVVSKGSATRAKRSTNTKTTAKQSASGVTKAKTPKTIRAKTKASEKTTISSSVQKDKKALGESKVREIAVKSKISDTPEVVQDKGFSLDDVHSILKGKNRKSTKAKSKGAEPKENATKAPKKKGPAKKVAKVKKLTTASIDDILGFGSSTAPLRPMREESKVPSKWLAYYNDLMSLRASLKGALGERSNETIGASARESSGELSLNSSDAGSETFDRDVALSMVASEQEALDEIEDAIDRIFDGTYGVCQETQKPIKKARLKAVPFTRFSLEGQAQYEGRKTKDRESTSGAFATISDSTMGQED